MSRRPKPKLDPQTAALCQAIRRRRHELGYTIEELSDRAELSPSFVNDIELGFRDPSMTTLHAIAAALEMPFAELFGKPKPLSPESLEAATAFAATRSELQPALLAVLRAILKDTEPR
jgi:transcriptional regulator with XRE-family HTH domain